MLVARVVRHQVQQDADPPAARLGHQAVEIVQRPEVGMDGAEVRDVVAPVRVGRRRDRREPDPVDAEPLEMVEMPDEAGKVADRRRRRRRRRTAGRSGRAPPPSTTARLAVRRCRLAAPRLRGRGRQRSSGCGERHPGPDRGPTDPLGWQATHGPACWYSRPIRGRSPRRPPPERYRRPEPPPRRSRQGVPRGAPG